MILGSRLVWGVALLAVLTTAIPAATCELRFQAKEYQLRDDYGRARLSDGVLQYYYEIPCPVYSWFWAYSGPITPEKVGVFYEIGDLSTGGFDVCDPANCHSLEMIRILDFAGYGTVYPGLFTIEMDVYCSDEHGCPVSPSLWTSGPWETHFKWNYIPVEPPLCLTSCVADPGPPPAGPRLLVIATHTGSCGFYPAWGFDNIGTAVAQECNMHDIGCLPALYPRPYTSHYATIHSGYYGVDFEYCPPLWFPDGVDTTRDGTQYGYIEFAWRIYLSCSGPTASEPATWGTIKALYR
jgi:hypothetical protein